MSELLNYTVNIQPWEEIFCGTIKHQNDDDALLLLYPSFYNQISYPILWK